LDGVVSTDIDSNRELQHQVVSAGGTVYLGDIQQ
jgi:hypothetical protein